MRRARRLAAVLLVAVLHAGVAAEPETAPRFTFNGGTDAPKPRGGTTRGVPLVIDRTPSDAWKALQAPGLEARERDRRAILAMAGTWRVAFDFVEVASWPGATPPDAKALVPYQSWGTEKVYVDRDEPGLVSLVHVLEMRILQKDGQVSAPMVTKHWRQTWRYQPAELVEYVGNDRWRRREVPASERRGTWSQTVVQVDESPRYASLGRWEHNASFSTWISGDTWRPLPRREWTVRRDYQVLAGTNRHTVGPAGWIQEENNLKAVLVPDRTLDVAHPYVGREYGVARYERIRGADFAEADRYHVRTRAFWDRVVDAWDADFARDGTITLRAQSDQSNAFVPLFERADRVAEQGPSPDDDAAIRAALDAMRAR